VYRKLGAGKEDSTVRTGDYYFSMKKETKIIDWEEVFFLYSTE
jgi:hypothetical protein